MKKMLTLRSAVILGVAGAAGSAAGAATEALALHAGQSVPSAAQFVTAAVSLWFADKLDRLITDDKKPR